jgi:hypothetical protein
MLYFLDQDDCTVLEGLSVIFKSFIVDRPSGMAATVPFHRHYNVVMFNA